MEVLSVKVTQKSEVRKVHNEGIIHKIVKDYKMNKFIILMMLPVLAWYIIFHYIPMYGVIIAFKNFTPLKGIMGSNWVGFKYFVEFFNSFYAWRVIRNTLMLSVYQLVFGFPAPIILALLINEIKNNQFKRVVQTATYLPHFISLVVICGMVISFTSKDGVVNNIITLFGGERSNLLLNANFFRTIYVSSGIWQNAGWQSIIYIAALASIDMEQYEAAVIDGASRWRQFIHVTLPGIAPTIIILLILNMGKMMSEGADKVILLYNPNTYETADTISSFVYRKGLEESNYSYSAAVGLFNTSINLLLLTASNWISKKVNEVSLW